MTDTNTAQMVADLKATDDAVRAKGWVAPGLGVPGAPLGLLSAATNPLGGLAAAGLSWFVPMVSFLGDGLTQLQGGNDASVTSGSQDFGAAGTDLAGVADSYRATVGRQTSDWSGTAATDYRESAAEHADGIAGLGQASNTTASAIIGAGQVVAQCIAEVTELIAEAVAQIVPILTQAIARAGETFGESVVEAIPPCVGIAVEYALRIAAKLAALVASGDNLMKLVQGGMAVVGLIQTALSSISQQSVSAEASAPADHGGAASTTSATDVGNAIAAADPGSSSPADSPSSLSSPLSAGGSGGGSSLLGGLADGTFTPTGSAGLDAPTYSSGVVPPPQGTVPDASRVSTSAAPSGGVAMGAGLAPGASVAGRGTDTVRREAGRQSTRPAGGGTPGGVPMGAMGAGHPAGDKDKEHQRKYTVIEDHEDDVVMVAPPVIK
jgi:hypothetical protein